MYDAIRVHILQTQQNTAYEKLNYMLGKSLPFSNLIPKIPAWQIIHDQVKV